MIFIEWIIAILIGYLLGCVQTSYFISRWIKKKDIRSIGSGNAGASNVTVTMGFHFGILTAFVDVSKAFLSILCINYIFPDSNYLTDLRVLAGSMAIIGHIFPFFMNFQGGKGMASYIGLILALDFHFGLNVIIFLILSTVITDFIAVGSIFIYLIMPFFFLFLPEYTNTSFFILFLIGIVGVFKHWINIRRIISGEEIGLRSTMRKEHLET